VAAGTDALSLSPSSQRVERRNGHGHGHGHGNGHGHGHDCDRGHGNNRRVNIAWLANDPNNTYDNANLDGAIEVASSTHSTVEAFFSGYDPALQLDQCNDAVESGRFDALILVPADSVGIVPCVSNAKAHGIPVVATDLPIGSDPTTSEPQVPGQVGAVLTPAAKWGTSVASVIVDVCAGIDPCNVVYIAGSFGIYYDQFALSEIDAAAAANPNIVLAAAEEAFYDESLAFSITQDLLTDDPNVHVVIGAGDQMARGAEDAIATFSSLPNTIEIIGAGAGAYGVEAVRDGRWYATFVTLPRDEGVLGAQIAIKAARSWTIYDAGIDPVELAGYQAFFTQDNQSDFGDFESQWPG
jgi:ribose transport system substrate-binding protein